MASQPPGPDDRYKAALNNDPSSGFWSGIWDKVQKFASSPGVSQILPGGLGSAIETSQALAPIQSALAVPGAGFGYLAGQIAPEAYQRAAEQMAPEGDPNFALDPGADEYHLLPTAGEVAVEALMPGPQEGWARIGKTFASLGGAMVTDPVNFFTGGIAGARKAGRLLRTGKTALQAGRRTLPRAGREALELSPRALANLKAKQVGDIAGSAAAGAVYAPMLGEGVYRGAEESYQQALSGNWGEAWVPAIESAGMAALGGLMGRGIRQDVRDLRGRPAAGRPAIEGAAGDTGPKMATELLPMDRTPELGAELEARVEALGTEPGGRSREQAPVAPKDVEAVSTGKEAPAGGAGRVKSQRKLPLDDVPDADWKEVDKVSESFVDRILAGDTDAALRKADVEAELPDHLKGHASSVQLEVEERAIFRQMGKSLMAELHEDGHGKGPDGVYTVQSPRLPEGDYYLVQRKDGHLVAAAQISKGIRGMVAGGEPMAKAFGKETVSPGELFREMNRRGVRESQTVSPDGERAQRRARIAEQLRREAGLAKEESGQAVVAGADRATAEGVGREAVAGPDEGARAPRGGEAGEAGPEIGLEPSDAKPTPKLAVEGVGQVEAAPLRPSPKPFHSHLRNVINKLKQTKASASEYLTYLRNPKHGVKAEEVRWTGLEDFLKQKGGKVTKSELQNFVADSDVEIHDVVLGGERAPLDTLPESVKLVHEEDGGYFFYRGNVLVGSGTTRVAAETEARHALAPTTDPTKYGPDEQPTLSLPGAKEGSYRELLLTRGKSRAENKRRARLDWEIEEADKARRTKKGTPESKAAGEDRFQDLHRQRKEGRKPYQDPHGFDQDDILAHVRFNERVGPNGERVLFLEEVQSAMHQEAKAARGNEITRLMEAEGISKEEAQKRVPGDFGYETPERRKAIEDRKKLQDDYQHLQDRMAHHDEHGVDPETGKALTSAEQSDMVGVISELRLEYRRLNQTEPLGAARVPSAPFGGHTGSPWHEMALRRMVRWAAEEGYDRISWINGEETAKRYDLSKRVSEITYNKENRLVAFDPQGQDVVNRVVPPEDLGGVIGKEPAGRLLAQKMVEGEGDLEPVRRISGEDLKIGGEWATNLYDVMIPSFMKRFGKQWGARVGETNFGAETVSSHKNWTEATSEARRLNEQSLERGEGEPYEVSGDDVVRAIRSGATAKELFQSMDITPGMRKSVVEKGVPKFAAEGEAKPETVRTVTREKVVKAFGGWRGVVEGVDKQGRRIWRVSLSGGRRILIREDGSIRLDDPETRAQFMRDNPDLDPDSVNALGLFQAMSRRTGKIGPDALVRLVKDKAHQGTIHHEAFHAAMEMALNAKQRRAILDAYGYEKLKQKALDKGETEAEAHKTAMGGAEEKASYAYGEWDGRPAGNPIFTAIRAFFRRVMGELNSEDVFKAVRSGEAWKQEAPKGYGPREVPGRVPAAKFAVKPREAHRLPGKWWKRMWGPEGPLAKQRIVAGEKRAAGAPPRMTSPDQYLSLAKESKVMAKQGEVAKDWYPISSREILDTVHGDKAEAERLAQLIAIYSPKQRVAPNWNTAIRAWLQYKGGAKKISSGMHTWQDRAAEKLLFGGEKWEGRKTNSFYGNLMHQIDPGNPAYKDLVTIDRQMMVAMGYDNKGPGDAQYAWAERHIRDVAYDLGWEPHQVQAAMWTSQKYRVEVLAKVKKGEKAPPVTLFSYREAAAQAMGQVNFETTPHPTSGDIPGIHRGTYDQKQEYMTAALEVGRDPDGGDRLARIIGIPAGTIFQAPGYYKQQSEPGAHATPQMPSAHGGSWVLFGEHAPGWTPTSNLSKLPKAIAEKVRAGGYHLDHATKTVYTDKSEKGRLSKTSWAKAVAGALSEVSGKSFDADDVMRPQNMEPHARVQVEAYAAATAYLYRQESVGYGKSRRVEKVAHANGYHVRLDRLATKQEVADLHATVTKYLGIDPSSTKADDVFPKATLRGVSLVNYSGIPAEKFNPAAKKACRDILGGDIKGKGAYYEDGGLVPADWKGNPDGRRILRTATGGRPTIQRALEHFRADVEKVNSRYAEKYGWGEAEPRVEAKPQEAGTPRVGEAAPPEARGPPKLAVEDARISDLEAEIKESQRQVADLTKKGVSPETKAQFQKIVARRREASDELKKLQEARFAKAAEGFEEAEVPASQQASKPASQQAPLTAKVSRWSGPGKPDQVDIFYRGGAGEEALLISAPVKDGKIVDPEGKVAEYVDEKGSTIEGAQDALDGLTKGEPGATAKFSVEPRDPLGRPMERRVDEETGEVSYPEAPRVETHVGQLRAAERAAEKPPEGLARDDAQRWNDMDPDIREHVREHDDEWYVKTTKRRALDSTESMALQMKQRGSYEKAQEHLSRMMNHQRMGRQKEAAAAKRDYIAESLRQVALQRAFINDGTSAGRALAARARVMKAAMDRPLFKKIRDYIRAKIKSKVKALFAVEGVTASRKLPADFLEAVKKGLSKTEQDALYKEFGEGLDPKSPGYNQKVSERIKEEFDVWGAQSEEAMLRQVIKEIPGATDKQINEIGQAMRSDPAAVPDLLRQAYGYSTLDKVLEWWKAGLLSAFSTDMANVTGNSIEAMVKIAETGTAAGIDRLLGAVPEGMRGEGDRSRYFGESAMEVAGSWQAIGPALKKLWSDLGLLVTGQEGKLQQGEKFAFQPGAVGKGWIPGVNLGKVVRTSFQKLGIADNFFKAIGRSAELNKLAYRRAAEELGAQADAGQVLARAKQIVQEVMDPVNPGHPDLLSKAMESELERTFQEKPSAVARAVLNVLRDPRYKGLQFALPFVKTPANILTRTIQRSPIGFVGAMKVYKKWKVGDSGVTRGDVADAFSRPLIGTAAVVGIYGLASQGLMTGGGPPDWKEQAIKKETGWQPHSFVWTNDDGTKEYIPFGRFEPFGTTLGMVADAWEAANTTKEGDFIDKALSSFVEGMADKTYLRGLSDVSNLVSNPKMFAGQYVTNLAGSFIPNIIARGAKAVDPVMRETKGPDAGITGIPERLKRVAISRIPGLSKQLPAKVGVTGEERVRPGTALGRFAGAFQVSKDLPGKEVEKFLLTTDFKPTIPKQTMTWKSQKLRLTDAEHDLLKQSLKRSANQLKRMVRSPAFTNLPPEMQEDRARKIYSKNMALAKKIVASSPSFRQRYHTEWLKERAS